MTHKPEWEERFDKEFGRFTLGENNGRERGWKSIEMLKPFLSQEIQRAKEQERERIIEIVKRERTDHIDWDNYHEGKPQNVAVDACNGILKDIASPDSKTSEV